jgi:predicted DNA-binding protein
MFDDGEDIDEYLDWENARRPSLESKRVNVDFPAWMVERLDRHAQRLGVTRQALIKTWIADRLEDMRMAAIVRQRQGQKSTPVRLEDL